MSKTISLQFDDEFITKSENILDDIGLDCQTFIKMCFKKLNKEYNISFLTTGSSPAIKQDYGDQAVLTQQDFAVDDKIDYPIRKTKNEITAQMRDYIWNLFKFGYNSNEKIDCSYFAKLANTKTGINQGSAYIYFLILDNLVTGIPNTRTMKYDDLVVYMSYIKEQLPKTCIINALKSLSESIPYWETHIQGYFAQKVSKLVSQYK